MESSLVLKNIQDSGTIKDVEKVEDIYAKKRKCKETQKPVGEWGGVVARGGVEGFL